MQSRQIGVIVAVAIATTTAWGSGARFVTVPKVNYDFSTDAKVGSYRKAIATTGDVVYAQRTDTLAWDAVPLNTFLQHNLPASKVYLGATPTDENHRKVLDHTFTRTIWPGEQVPYWSVNATTGETEASYNPVHHSNYCNTPGQGRTPIGSTYCSGWAQLTNGAVTIDSPNPDGSKDQLKLSKFNLGMRMHKVLTDLPVGASFKARLWTYMVTHSATTSPNHLLVNIGSNFKIPFETDEPYYHSHPVIAADMGRPWPDIGMPFVASYPTLLEPNGQTLRFRMEDQTTWTVQVGYLVNLRDPVEARIITCHQTWRSRPIGYDSTDLNDIQLVMNPAHPHSKHCEFVSPAAAPIPLDVALYYDEIVNKTLRHYISKTQDDAPTGDLILFQPPGQNLIVFVGSDSEFISMPFALAADEHPVWMSSAIYQR